MATNTKCDKCGETFKTRQGMLLHQRKALNCDEEIIYKCERCNKVFSANSLLERHLSRKTSCVKVKNQKKVAHYRPLEDELKILETQHKFKMEEIAAQKEKGLAVELEKIERKGKGSIAIYIISNKEHIVENKYKVGKTSQTRQSIQTTYQRYLCEATVLFYKLFDGAGLIETNILNHFKEKRQKTASGRPSEWICEDVEVIKEYILSLAE